MSRPRPPLSAPVPVLAAVLFTAVLSAWTPGAAEPAAPVLRLPIDCSLGKDCFIQNLVDTDPGPEFRDYACGSLGYNSDTGVDFRLPNLAAMRRGVAVLAAADGEVVRIRDGMTDTGIPPEGVEGLQGRFGGNAVVISHGNGWETQYSHLRLGSVRVKPGDVVKAGDPIGMVGLSGRTQFPHVEMIVRRDGATVDPFLGPDGFKGCDGPRSPLWRPDLAGLLAYRPTELLQAGFVTDSFDEVAARDGAYDTPSFRPGAASLIFWTEVKGTRAGDRITLQVIAPDTRRLFDGSASITRNQAVSTPQAVVKAPAGGFAAGTYKGRLIVEREGRRIVDAVREVTRAP